MNTNDISKWRDLLQDLTDTAEQNRVIIREIRDEVELQKQRNKKEIQKLSQEVGVQVQDLEDLIRELDQTELFTLPSDLKARDSFMATLQAQVEKSKKLVRTADSMLDSQTTADTTMEKIRIGTRKSRERVNSYLPKLFRQEHILGNWIHRFNQDQFTCQSFWDDSTFKEYDFDHGKLADEREGTYQVNQDEVTLRYQDGTKDTYKVLSFSDQSINYNVGGNEAVFEYMPETVLNKYLDEDSMNAAD